MGVETHLSLRKTAMGASLSPFLLCVSGLGYLWPEFLSRMRGFLFADRFQRSAHPLRYYFQP